MSPRLRPSRFICLTTFSCRLRQGRREELSLIGSQFWFFGLAVFAVSICDFATVSIVEAFFFSWYSNLFRICMCERPLKLFPCSRYTQPRPYHCTYACHCVVGLCVVAHDESHRSNATPYRGSRLAMPSRLVGAVLHKAIRVSGVSREFVCLCLSQSVRSRSQTLSCTWMRSFSPRTSPGVSSRYSLLYPFADISLLTYVRCIAPLPSGASVRRKTSCGCMGYGSVRHCALAASFDVISF